MLQNQNNFDTTSFKSTNSQGMEGIEDGPQNDG